MLGYKVVTNREIAFPKFRKEPYTHGEVIPVEAFETIPHGLGQSKIRTLTNLAWISPTLIDPEEPGAVKIDDDESADEPWPRHKGGPWFLTPPEPDFPEGRPHRGKEKALQHMEKL